MTDRPPPSSPPSTTPIEDSTREVMGEFVQAKTMRSNIDYVAPQGGDILEGARGIVRQSPAGQRLLAVADTQGIQISIVRAPREGVFTPDGRTVIITLKPTDRTPTPKHAFMLAYGIRHAEMLLLGYVAPNLKDDPQEHSNWTFSKNLDGAKQIFRIYEDLQSLNGIMNLFDILKDLEIDFVYEQWKSGVDDLTLMRLLVKNLEELEQQKEG